MIWRIIHIALIAGMAVIAGTLIVFASEPTVNAFISRALLLLAAIPFLCAVIALAIQIFMTAKGGTGGAALRRDGRIVLLHPLIIGLAFLVSETGWAFHWRFALSRGLLESAAREALVQGQRADTVRWLGLYWTEGTQITPAGYVSVQLGACGFSSTCEFEFHPRGDCVTNARQSATRLTDRWCLKVLKHAIRL
jgi:hypothetical protein